MAQDLKADIIFQQTGEMVSVSDRIEVSEPQKIDIKLEIMKTGKSGKASTVQGNSITAEPGKSYQSNHLALALQTGDKISALLNLYINGKLVLTKERTFTFDPTTSKDQGKL
ncbi:curli-like amyloid fiber formation chaperone CsgH [uncultured Cohaesibacter sp.]|uniref:curli-like amyloid fiber formation chaperone CsgH n=1 Tax=uncultured Cohaesibacter sp. TaxID=1002546 RepID=UPI00292D8615|nr:curli-like amyloid fiber formation chaperone CsgH [uncultured Cohaesibacter sp.]